MEFCAELIVSIVKQMLHLKASFIEHPKYITLVISDDVRHATIDIIAYKNGVVKVGEH